MNDIILPEELSSTLREISPKKRVPPSALWGEIKTRFENKYGYWPGALTQFDLEIEVEQLNRKSSFQ